MVSNEILRKIASIAYVTLLIVTGLCVTGVLLYFVFLSPVTALSIINSYLVLILSSWPAAIILLGGILLITQKSSIAVFISKRMVSVGMDGIKGSTDNLDAVLNQMSNASIAEGAEISEDITPVVTEGIIETEQETEDTPLVRALTAHTTELNKKLQFEKIYNTIFGTQLSVLGFLRTNVEGLWYRALASMYEDWRKEHEVLIKYPLSDYVGYLESNDLVKTVEDSGNKKLLITDRGNEFLEYIEQNNYSKSKNH